MDDLRTRLDPANVRLTQRIYAYEHFPGTPSVVRPNEDDMVPIKDRNIYLAHLSSLRQGTLVVRDHGFVLGDVRPMPAGSITRG